MPAMAKAQGQQCLRGIRGASTVWRDRLFVPPAHYAMLLCQHMRLTALDEGYQSESVHGARVGAWRCVFFAVVRDDWAWFAFSFWQSPWHFCSVSALFTGSGSGGIFPRTHISVQQPPVWMHSPESEIELEIYAQLLTQATFRSHINSQAVIRIAGIQHSGPWQQSVGQRIVN